MLVFNRLPLAGGSIRWNEEELIACGDCADYILNLKLSLVYGPEPFGRQ